MFQPISARQRCSFCILPKRNFHLSEATTTNSSEVPRPKSRLAVKVLHKKNNLNRTPKKDVEGFVMDYSQFSISKCSFVQLIGSYLSRFDLYILASRRSTDFHEYQFAASKWRFGIFRTEKRLSLLAVPTLPVRVCTLAKPRSKIRSSCPGHCIVAHHGHFQRVEFQGFMMVLGVVLQSK